MNWYKISQQGNTEENLESNNLQDKLKVIESKYKSSVKYLDLYESQLTSSIIINMIEVPKNQRNQGIGSSIIQDIINLADQEKKRVELTVGLKDKLHGTTSRSRLVRFYKRFGFIENKGKNKDYTTSASMYREPI